MEHDHNVFPHWKTDPISSVGVAVKAQNKACTQCHFYGHVPVVRPYGMVLTDAKLYLKFDPTTQAYKVASTKTITPPWLQNQQTVRHLLWDNYLKANRFLTALDNHFRAKQTPVAPSITDRALQGDRFTKKEQKTSSNEPSTFS